MEWEECLECRHLARFIPANNVFIREPAQKQELRVSTTIINYKENVKTTLSQRGVKLAKHVRCFSTWPSLAASVCSINFPKTPSPPQALLTPVFPYPAPYARLS